MKTAQIEHPEFVWTEVLLTQGVSSPLATDTRLHGINLSQRQYGIAASTASR